MILTSKKDVLTAIRNGDITEGMTYTTTAGVFQITNLQTDGNDRIGYSVELYDDGDGNEEPHGYETPITAIDIIGAEF